MMRNVFKQPRCNVSRDHLKMHFCKHNIGLSIKFNNYTIPDTAKSVPLAQKRKRGRLPRIRVGGQGNELFKYLK